MPEDVDACVDQGGGEDGIGFAPGPAIEEAGDGCKQDVAPVWEMHIAKVGEAEEDGGGDPACGFALGGLGEEILQQAAEEKLFGPGSEEKNGDGKWDEGFPFVDTRRVDEEMEF